MSLPAWGAWIEMSSALQSALIVQSSLPAWGAWIEILVLSCLPLYNLVAPRMGSVD